MRSRPSWQPICNKMGNLQNKLNVLLNEAIELDKRLLSALPKSILQEAIQGKLVPQDTTEEPASTLLQKIRDEKNRLVVEGKLKKKDLTDSIIFKGDDNAVSQCRPLQSAFFDKYLLLIPYLFKQLLRCTFFWKLRH